MSIRTITVDSGRNVFVHIKRRRVSDKRTRDAKYTSLAQAKAALAPFISINKKSTGEYRVNFAVSGTEATAYYSDDLDDAVETGLDMIRREKARKNTKDKRTRDHWYRAAGHGDFTIWEGAGTNGGEWKAECRVVTNTNYKKGEYEIFKSRAEAERFCEEQSD